MDRIYIAGFDEVPKRLTLKEEEELRLSFVILPGLSADLPFEIDISKSGVNLEIYCVYICPHSERVRFNFTVRHLVGGSRSRQVFRGVVGGTARAEFDGLIYVAPGAQKTKAFQDSRTVLLSEGAFAESRPQLEIYADDVECSHGATSGFLNQDELFYLRSRGIPEEEARRMQMLSFVAPAIAHLPEDVKARILERL